METVRPTYSKSKQVNKTNLNISFSMVMKKELLRWDSSPRHTAYEADALRISQLSYHSYQPVSNC